MTHRQRIFVISDMDPTVRLSAFSFYLIPSNASLRHLNVKCFSFKTYNSEAPMDRLDGSSDHASLTGAMFRPE